MTWGICFCKEKSKTATAATHISHISTSLTRWTECSRVYKLDYDDDHESASDLWCESAGEVVVQWSAPTRDSHGNEFSIFLVELPPLILGGYRKRELRKSG